MKQSVTRRLMTSCIHPETYQYFLGEHQIGYLWVRIENAYGKIQHNAFNVMWIETHALLLKAPLQGTPLTVVRKRLCSRDDIERLHQLIEFTQ